MKTNHIDGRLLMALAAAVLSVAGPGAMAGEIMHARVSYDAGGGMVKGTDDAEWSYATINTLILPGDTAWVDEQGTMELEMSGGTFLRMADGSKADIVSLPPAALVRGWTGAFYVQRISRSTGGFVFETPVCMVSIARDSHVRVDVLGEGSTTVTVRWGQATVRSKGGADGGAVVLSRGQRSFTDPGFLPSEAMPFNPTGEDAFDAWSRERARLLAVGAEAVPEKIRTETVPIGAADLGPYGEWMYVDSVQYWRPTVVVDFIPYRSGHWSYVPRYGHVWVGAHPFSYTTSHYGRWMHHGRHGWLWTYRDTWSPAWVATVRYGPNFVWCPLDPWDCPIVTTADFYTVGGLRFGVYASTYCGADMLLGGPCMVRPCTPVVVHHGIPANQIHIWNINAGRRGPRARAVVPYRDSRLSTRDYTPRRVIRGPAVLGKDGRPARARVVSLEQNSGRPSFRGNVRLDVRSRKTPVDSTRVDSRLRSVRLGSDITPKTPRGRSLSRDGAVREAGVRSPGIARKAPDAPSARTVAGDRVTPRQSPPPDSRTNVRSTPAKPGGRTVTPTLRTPAAQKPAQTDGRTRARDVTPNVRAPNVRTPNVRTPNVRTPNVRKAPVKPSGRTVTPTLRAPSARKPAPVAANTRVRTVIPNVRKAPARNQSRTASPPTVRKPRTSTQSVRPAPVRPATRRAAPVRAPATYRVAPQPSRKVQSPSPRATRSASPVRATPSRSAPSRTVQKAPTVSRPSAPSRMSSRASASRPSGTSRSTSSRSTGSRPRR